MSWDDELKATAITYDALPNSKITSPASAVFGLPPAGAPARASSGSSDGCIVGGASSGTPAKGAVVSATMSPTLRQAAGLDGEGLDREELDAADGAGEYAGATAADPAVSADATRLGATVASGGNIEPGAADTPDDIDELSGKTIARVEAAEATELDSKASASVNSPLLGELINDLAAASAGFKRAIPAACITCPACNGKHRTHTCRVPLHERPRKQDRPRPKATENQPSSEPHLESTETGTALQDDASRLGRQRKRKVVWEPKPEGKRVNRNVLGSKGKKEPLLVYQGRSGRGGTSSSISNTGWQQPDMSQPAMQPNWAAGPRPATGGNPGSSKMISGGREKPAPSNTSKTPPSWGPVPEICVQESVGKRIACYWDTVRACCWFCVHAPNYAALVVDSW